MWGFLRDFCTTEGLFGTLPSEKTWYVDVTLANQFPMAHQCSVLRYTTPCSYPVQGEGNVSVSFLDACVQCSSWL